MLRSRIGILVLALVSHLFVTFGFPLHLSALRHKTSTVPYPCQSRSCGCLTSEQCWAGDCCCFTLAEKIAWAEANGIEPPEHARQLARIARPDADAFPARVSEPCCETAGAAPACCHPEKTSEAPPASECPQCDPRAPTACEDKLQRRPGVRWVLGIFAKKCRAEGMAGLFQFDPAIVVDLAPGFATFPEAGDRMIPCSVRGAAISHAPPTRPPRSF